MGTPQLILIEMVEGDTLPVLTLEYAGVIIEGYGFELRARRKDGTVLRRGGTITDAATGKVAFMWEPGDMKITERGSTQETQPAQITITNTTGGVLTRDSFALRVKRRLI